MTAVPERPNCRGHDLQYWPSVLIVPRLLLPFRHNACTINKHIRAYYSLHSVEKGLDVGLCGVWGMKKADICGVVDTINTPAVDI